MSDYRLKVTSADDQRALSDREAGLQKENDKLKGQSLQMQSVVQQRLGYLERQNELKSVHASCALPYIACSSFKVASLQHKLAASVDKTELDAVNR